MSEETIREARLTELLATIARTEPAANEHHAATLEASALIRTGGLRCFYCEVRLIPFGQSSDTEDSRIIAARHSEGCDKRKAYAGMIPGLSVAG